MGVCHQFNVLMSEFCRKAYIILVASQKYLIGMLAY